MITSLSLRVRICCEERSTSARLEVVTGDTVTCFDLDAGGARLRIGLVLTARERPVDVSLQPAMLASLLRPSSDGSPDDVRAVAAWLSTFCTRHGLWAGAEVDVVRGLTGASFPLLGQMYTHGAATLTEVPRWAAPALAEPKPRAAAQAVLGASVNRPVIAALAASLLPTAASPTPPALYPLALVVMGSAVLAPDALARVIRAGTHDRQPHPSTWPTTDGVTQFRRQAPRLGARRVEQVLTEAATTADGPRLLRDTARLFGGIPAGLCARLPSGLSELHDRCIELTPAAPPPAPPPEPPATAARRPATPPPSRPRARATAPARALVAPDTTGRDPGPCRDFWSALQRLHGRRVSDRLRLVLPETADDLAAWGRRLGNCLDTYAAAARSRRSALVGIEVDGVLTYCAELAPHSRTIRQLLGAHNRAVPAADAGAICSGLIAEGLIDPFQRANRPWVDLCETATGDG